MNVSTEDRLARLWAQTLGVPEVRRDQSYFALGGQSVTAMRLISRIDREFGASLSLRDIFEHPTLTAMAEQIGHRAGGGRRLPRPPRSPRIPLSAAQESFWRIAHALPGVSMFNQVLCLDVHGDIESELLVEGLRDAVRRHEALCATFSGAPGQAVQTISRLAVAPVTSERHAGRPDAVVPRVVAEETATAFDLERQIPVRARLLEFDGSRVLVVTTHHIAFDGWSRGILMDDLAACCRVRAEGAEPVPAGRGFSSYVTWQHEQRKAGAWADSVRVWREVLAPPLPTLRLPGAREADDDFRTARREVVLDAELSDAVQAFASAERTTAFTVLMTAFMAVVALACDADEGCVAVQVANRTWPEVVDMVGPLANTLVVRAALDRAGGFAGFLHEVQRACLVAYDHQEVPFEHVVQELREVVDVAALLRIGFAVHEQFPTAEIPGGRLAAREVGADEDGKVDPTTFELVLELRPEGDEFRGELTYKSALYPPEVIEDLVGRYLAFLLAALGAPATAIGGGR